MQAQCTSDLPYQLSLSSTNTNTLSVTGTLNGLSYTLSLPSPPTGGHKGTGTSVTHTVSVRNESLPLPWSVVGEGQMRVEVGLRDNLNVDFPARRTE